MAKEKEDIWEQSPITGRDEVLVEYNDKTGSSRMCIGSGFYTNEYPFNYKKHPKFDIQEYEQKLPTIVKELRFDDGESYWYPSTIQSTTGVVFPVGQKDNYKWCWAPIKELSTQEKEEKSQDVDFTSKIEMDEAEYFDRYLDAAKKINGVMLDELS